MNEYIKKKTKNRNQIYYIFIDEIQLSVAVSNPYIDSKEKNVTFIKDILERNNIQNEKEVLELLLDFTSSAIGSLTNPTKLSRRFLSEKQIKISSNIISKYISFFEETYVIYHADRYDVKGSRYFSTPLKYYVADIGLRNARLDFRQVEDTHIMENIIYNDLLRRGYNIDVGVVEHDFKKEGNRRKVQLEVDFVINKGHKRYYTQSAFNVDSTEKREQETASLKKNNKPPFIFIFK